MSKRNNTLILLFIVIGFISLSGTRPAVNLKKEVLKLEKERVMEDAEAYLTAEIQTVTGASSPRSAGGIHDFYSEGDYWWPDSANPEGPYVKHDGLTNPDNFIEHRVRMRRLSLIVPGLVAAYTIKNDEKYAERAIEHLTAWFADEETRMNPDMLYSQAIYGRVTGRGIGIIDAIHLVEVVNAAMVLEDNGVLKGEDLAQIKDWFASFNEWITTHPYGLAEKNNGNNHSTCWAMQAAMYAKFTGNDSLLEECRDFYQQTLLPEQMIANGSFPKETKRTKPYGYSLFNLDAMYTLLHILSDKYPDIWKYSPNDSLDIRQAVEFMYPYIKDKSTWPYQADVMYFEDWPMRHASLLFAYMAFGDQKYFDLWKTLEPESEKNEVVRNFFVRQPLLWVEG
ncbi:MAG: alginate lyase family protein [Cyclobacteriaceae bacterium]